VDAVTSTGEYPERAIRRCPETGELTVLKMTRGYNVPLVAEDVFDKIPPIDPEPSLEAAIAEAQTHRTVWGDVVIGDGGFLSKILTGWTPPTDAEIDSAAADGAIDDVFHADQEVE
jgi:putative intracellular protease/amidase